MRESQTHLRLNECSQAIAPRVRGLSPKREHEERVRALRSNISWRSDSIQIRCWDGRRLEVVFDIDTRERQILSMAGVVGNLQASDANDALALAYERRFKADKTPVKAFEWITDSGSIFIAHRTQDFASSLGLIPCQTPAYSSESNAMSEPFVKLYKQDYVYNNDCRTTKTSELPLQIGAQITTRTIHTRH